MVMVNVMVMVRVMVMNGKSVMVIFIVRSKSSETL